MLNVTHLVLLIGSGNNGLKLRHPVLSWWLQIIWKRKYEYKCISISNFKFKIFTFNGFIWMVFTIISLALSHSNCRMPKFKQHTSEFQDGLISSYLLYLYLCKLALLFQHKLQFFTFIFKFVPFALKSSLYYSHYIFTEKHNHFKISFPKGLN